MTKLLILFSPILAYLGLAIGLTIFSLIVLTPYQINNWTNLLKFNYQPDLSVLFNPQVQFWKQLFFAAIAIELINIVVWSIIKYRRNYLRHFDILSFVILTGMHLFFLGAIFVYRLDRDLPILIWLSLLALGAHLAINFLPYFLNPSSGGPAIYFWHQAKKDIRATERKINRLVNASLK